VNKCEQNILCESVEFMRLHQKFLPSTIPKKHTQTHTHTHTHTQKQNLLYCRLG